MKMHYGNLTEALGALEILVEEFKVEPFYGELRKIVKAAAANNYFVGKMPGKKEEISEKMTKIEAIVDGNTTKAANRIREITQRVMQLCK